MTSWRPILALVAACCGWSLHGTTCAQAKSPQMAWGPSPVAPGHSTRLAWQWSATELPDKGVLSNGSGGPCPASFVNELANQQSFPTRFSMGWIPDTAGTYSCTLSFVMPKDSPLVAPITATLVVSAANLKK